jgi:enoyl-CoA hydratase/carnithine racemase
MRRVQDCNADVAGGEPHGRLRVTELLLRERRGCVEVPTLNRPDKRNALSRELADALASTRAEVEVEDEVRRIVLTGAGDRAFRACMDLAEFASDGENRQMPYKTRKMFFTGEFVDAHEFDRLGAVEAVVPHDDLQTTARELAAVMASKSPMALRLAKESPNRVEDLGLKDGYRIEQDYTQRITRFEDSAEARRSYLGKREPEWQCR